MFPSQIFPSQIFADHMFPRSGPVAPTLLVLSSIASPIVLVEIQFDSGSRYYSYEDVASPSQFYKGNLISVGSINREVPLLGADYRISDCIIQMSNIDLEFSAMKATEPFRNRTVKIKLGDVHAGLSGFITVYTGKISNWIIRNMGCEIQVRDASFDKFSGKIGGYLIKG
jgi:hypothetical protein